MYDDIVKGEIIKMTTEKNVKDIFNDVLINSKIALEQFMFSVNNKETQEAVVESLNKLLNHYIESEMLIDYAIVCDDSNNTENVIHDNELRVDLAIQPVGADEFIAMPLRVTLIITHVK